MSRDQSFQMSQPELSRAATADLVYETPKQEIDLDEFFNCFRTSFDPWI